MDEGKARALRDPTLWTLVAVAVAVALFGVFRTDVRFAGAPKWYWIEKLRWGPQADVVVAGDSRVYRGVDPSQLQAGGVGLNFGFSSGKFTKSYLDHAAALLDPDGARVLVLGVSIFSIERDGAEQSGYAVATENLARLRLPVPLARFLSEWEIALEPVSLDAGVGSVERGVRLGLANQRALAN